MRCLVVIPAYQAARTVGAVVAGLRSQGFEPAELLVVDDGSTDDTAAVAKAAGAQVARHERNRGKGAALETGLQAARAEGFEAIVTLDADGQHPPQGARRLASHPAPAEDLVLGVRDLVGAGAPSANQFSNGISNRFLSWFSGLPLRDTQCGLRRYPVQRTLALAPRAEGFAFEAEIILRAAKAGIPIHQVPIEVVYPPQGERTSHFHVVKDPARIIYRVLHTVLTVRRGS